MPNYEEPGGGRFMESMMGVFARGWPLGREECIYVEERLAGPEADHYTPLLTILQRCYNTLSYGKGPLDD